MARKIFDDVVFVNFEKIFRMYIKFGLFYVYSVYCQLYEGLLFNLSYMKQNLEWLCCDNCVKKFE